MGINVPEVIGRGVQFTTSPPADIHPEEWSPRIHEIIPAGKAPFMAIIMAAGRDVTPSRIFHWWEEPFPEQRGDITDVFTDVILSTAYVSGGVVGDVLYFQLAQLPAEQVLPGHTIRVFNDVTGVDIVVDVLDVSLAGANSFIAGALMQADTDDDLAGATISFWMMADAREENASMADSLVMYPTEFNNQTQITQTTISFSGSELAELERVTPDKRIRARRNGLLRHQIQMEKTALFGVKATKIKNGATKRFTSGVVTALAERVPGNIFNFVTDETYDATTWLAGGLAFLNEKWEIIFRYSETGRKTAFIGSLALKAINDLVEATGQYELTTRQTSFGIQIVTLVTVHGTIDLIHDPLFSTHPVALKSMFVTEMHLIKYRPLRTRDTMFLDDVQEGKSGKDGVEEGWRTEWGLQYNNLDAMGYFTNLGDDNPA